MMKQNTILICVLFFGLFSATATPLLGGVEIEQSTAACNCACDAEKNLQILRELYNNNGGANWSFPANAIYEDIQNNKFESVPNSGVAWEVDAPNAIDLMGTWHGVTTNTSNCITELILWSGPYDTDNTFSFAPQGVGLTGDLPANIGQLCTLEKLLLPHNELTGNIPASIEELCNVEILLLHNNELDGDIPSEIGNLENLQHLGLHFNGLTGTLPASITNLTNLEILHLNNNNLMGSLPTDIGNLDQLIVIDLSNNSFSGMVPASIVNIGSNSATGQIEELLLQNNALDSLPNISNLAAGVVDVSGNHFTFDDIIPNIRILTKYDNQTLVLNKMICTEEGEPFILSPGFDAIVDSGVYGVFSTYHWSRPGTPYRDTSTLNAVNFSSPDAFSSGNFSVEVTNALAPDLRLEVSNILLEVNPFTSFLGTFEVCADSEEEYSILFGFGGYDFSVNGGEIIASDASSVKVNWGNSTRGEICATTRGFCQATTCQEISIFPQITVFISTPDTLNCNTTTSTLRGMTNVGSLDFSWYTTTDTVTLSQTDTISITSPGKYILQGINDRGCEARDTAFVVEQIDKFDVQIIGGSSFCKEEGTILATSNEFSSYRWSTGETTSTIQVTEEGAYQVTVTNENDCTAADSFEIEAITTPFADITKSGDLDCTNDQVQLSFGNDTESLTLKWENSEGTTLGNNNTLLINTPDTYSLIVTNEAGCSNTAQIEVMKDEDVVIPLIAGTTSLCEGATGHLSVEEIYTSYNWSTGDTTAFIAIDDSRLIYSVTVTSATGCSGSSSVTVEKRPKPTLLIGGQKEICSADSTRLFVSDQYIDYTWSNGSTSFETTVHAIGTYSVTVVDTDNCTNIDSVEVIEAMPFTATIEGDTRICDGVFTELVASQFPNVSYEWSTGETIPALLEVEAGVYQLTITDANNCSSTATTVVTVAPPPPITFIGDTTLCASDSSRLVVAETYPTYNWSGGSTEQSIQVNQAGTYEVTVIDEANCKSTASIEVIERSTIEPEIDGNLFFCQGESVTLSAKGDYDSYFWSTGENGQSITIDTEGIYTLIVADDNGCVGDTIVNIISLSNPTPQIIGNSLICRETAISLKTSGDYTQYVWSTGDTTATVSVNESGSYQVTVTNEFGCTGTTAFSIEEAPDLAVNIIGNTAICKDASTTLQAVGTYLSYNWSTGADSTAIVVQELGIYSLTVTDPSGCIGTASVEVTEESTIFPEIIGTTTLCGGQTAEIKTDSEYASYQWSTGAITQSITVDSIGTYLVTVSNTTGCTGIATIEVDAATSLQPTIKGDLAICEGQSTLLSLEETYEDYVWTGGIMRSNLLVFEAGTYTVVVTDSNGCTEEATAVVEAGTLPPPAIETEFPFLCTGEVTFLNVAEGYASYSWNNNQVSNNIIAFEPGLYSLTITDENGCQGVNSIDIVGIPSPMLEAESPKRLCTGDSTSTLLSVPDEFAQYSWSNGDTTATIAVQQAGTYRITVTNEFGCSSTTQLEVIGSDQQELILGNSLRKDTLDCNNNELVLFPIKNSIDPFTYRWEDTSRMLLGTAEVLKIFEGGTYRLIGTNLNTGCISVLETSIVEAKQSVTLITTDSLKVLFCNNREADIDFSSSINADQFEWEIHRKDGFKKELDETNSIYTATDTGKYLVIGMDTKSGCVDSAWVEVIDTSYTIEPTVTVPDRLCQTDIAIIAVNESYEAYSWNNDSTTREIKIEQGGLYSVTVTDTNQCEGTKDIEIASVEADTLNVTLEGDIIQVCEGEAVELDFIVKKNGVGPYNLTLSNGREELFFDNIENGAGLELFPTVENRYSIMEVVDLGNSCFIYNGESPVVEFEVLAVPIANSLAKDNCKLQGREGSTFDLAALESTIRNGSNAIVQWYQDTTGNTSIPNTPFTTSSSSDIIYARINDGNCSSDYIPVALTTTDCTTSLEFEVEVGEELNLSDLPGTEREVYITNRWGDLVYMSTDYEKDGDKFRGANLPQGAYYIYIKNNEKDNDIPVPYKGIIYLLK